MMKTLLVIDNRDSYTYNLVQMLRKHAATVQALAGLRVQVCSADASAQQRQNLLGALANGEVAGVVISPGPGHPARPEDFALSGAVIDAVLGLANPTPLLGVCLGHQGLALRFGCTVQAAPQPRHGWVSLLEHSGKGLFAGMPAKTSVTRYHSLAISEPDADSDLMVSARSEDGIIQAVEVRGKPWFGVQFHPESIASTDGSVLITNFLAVVRDHLAWSQPGASTGAGAAEQTVSGEMFDVTPEELSGRVSDGDFAALPGQACGELLGSLAQRPLYVATQLVEQRTDGVPGQALRVNDTGRLCELFWSGTFVQGAGSFWLESGRVDEDARYSILGDSYDLHGDGSAHMLSFRHGQVQRQVFVPPDRTGATSALPKFAPSKFVPPKSAKTVHTSTGHMSVETWSAEPCANVFAFVEQEMELPVIPVEPGAGELPFTGGLIGYFSYEAGVENMGVKPVAQPMEPAAVWLRPARFIIADRHTGELRACVVGVSPEAARTSVAKLANAVANVPGLATEPVKDGATAPEPGSQPGPAHKASPLGELVPGQWVDGSDEYRRKIAQCQAKLMAGETYELCLTNEFRVDPGVDPDPLDLFVDLLKHHPAQYMAYLETPEITLVSASPERFLRTDGVVRARRDVRLEEENPGDGTKQSSSSDAVWGITRGVRTFDTKPIKGTIARHSEPAIDERLAASLAANAKTFAENLMIADLLRNDLGKLAVPGTVEVPKFMNVESYASLHQLVSTVRADVPANISPVRVAATLLPGGSMTGAPKLRSVEILSGLENRARGAYSGALGFFSSGGATHLSIVIRTAVRAGSEPWRIGSGGAIVLDSDPVAETTEVELKVRALREAFVRAATTG